MPTSRTYTVAVIGTGFAERVQLPALRRHARFEPVALAARDPENTARVAQKFGVARWYTDWREMVAEGGFDALSITAPPHLHHEMVMAALDAGMHVLCEKPMALNVAQAQAMLARARESGCTAMINHEFRHLGARQRFGELLQDGHIGELQRLVVRFHTSWRASADRPWNWWSDRARGGGLLGAIGSHYFDAMHHWLGLLPERVWGKLDTFTRELPDPEGGGKKAVTADDAFIAVLDLGDGKEMLFDFSATVKPAPSTTVTAIGTRGTMVLEDDKRLLAGVAGGELKELPFVELERHADDPWLLAPFLQLLDDFAQGIDSGTSPTPNFEDGLAHQCFIDAVKASDASGCWVMYKM